MEESDEEKIRRRRERAAAWTTNKASASEPAAASGGWSGEQTLQPAARSEAVSTEKHSTNAADDPGDWKSWANQVGGGWRNMPGGLETLSASFGFHNSAAVKEVTCSSDYRGSISV